MGHIPTDITFLGQPIMSNNDIKFCEKIYCGIFTIFFCSITIGYLINN